jgi:hypothetical protein
MEQFISAPCLKHLEAVSDVVGFPAESARLNLSLAC